jgi:hypothetical protein
MMDFTQIVAGRRMVAAAALLLGAAAFPAPAQGPSLTMLDTLEKGNWELRQRGSGAPIRNLCLGDARALIQIQHPRAGCSRYVIADGAEEVTVHYTCPGAGHGRTTVRHETNRLVQIDTQGIAGGAPFSNSFEARRTTGC